MKLIIDLPDRIYKMNQNTTLNIADTEILEKAIRDGTPLDDVKAEIEASKWADRDTRIERNALAGGIDKALEIIDKHISGKVAND